MSYIRTRGIIVREVNTGEADKIVTIFTRSHGKVSGSAKGARRPKSKFVAGTQLLCYSEFILYKGRDIYSINSAEVIEPFYEIRNDMVKLTYSAHILELISDVIQENQPSTKVLQLLLNTLHMLSKTDKSPELVTRVFELRFLCILGYAPSVRNCTECGNEDSAEMFFSFTKCGIICGDCRALDKQAVRIASGTARAMRHIVHSKMEELFSFTLSPEVLGELGRIMRRYIRERLERDFNKLDFLKTLEKI